MEFDQLLAYLFRWIHMFAGVAWIGLLYYFNFVQTGTGCVQSPECIACLTEHSGLGHELSWAAAPCDDSCYPDGLVAEQTIRALRYKAAHPEQPFFLAAGFKRPHL